MDEARNRLTPGTDHGSEGSSEKDSRPKFPIPAHHNHRRRHHLQLDCSTLSARKCLGFPIFTLTPQKWERKLPLHSIITYPCLNHKGA